MRQTPGRSRDRPLPYQRSRAAAERLWTLAYDQKTGALKHEVFRGQAQTDGFLQDYASLGSSFMMLFDVTGDKIWQNRAAQLADHMLSRFARQDGSFATTTNEKDLLIPIADEGDLESPSGTSMAIGLLLRLHAGSGEARYLDAATNAVRRLSGQFQDHPEAWASAIADLNRYPLLSTRQSVTAASTATGANTSGEFHVPVDDNFHINANPASFDYLIPTSLEFKDIKPAKIEYPKAIRFTAEFAPEGLDVYEGSVAITAKFPKDSLKGIKAIQGTVTAQACTSQICLPPSELPVSIGNVGQ